MLRDTQLQQEHQEELHQPLEQDLEEVCLEPFSSRPSLLHQHLRESS
jgi:hypothetical protein